MRTNTLNFRELGFESSLRMDVAFQQARMLFPASDYYRFCDLFDIIPVQKIQINDLDEFNYVEIGDVDAAGDITPSSLSTDNRNETNESIFKKIEKGDIIQVSEGDILLPCIRPNLNKTLYITSENSHFYYTKAFIHLRPKRHGRILFYALKSIFLPAICAVARQGKSYPTLTPEDLSTLKFSCKEVDRLFSLNNEQLRIIDSEEESIRKAKVSLIKKPQYLIDTYFTEHFGLLFDEFQALSTQHIFTTAFSDIADSLDMRMGVRFHRPSRRCIMQFAKREKFVQLRDIVTSTPELGSGISPKQYDEQGNFYYISMASISGWKFSAEKSQRVTEEYAKCNEQKSSVQKNDILMARSGEGTIGKCALITDSEIDGIFADFVIRMHVSNNYLPKFVYYYFRTSFFQHLIECYKKGLGNTTNIFPSQLEKFPVPSVPLEIQQKAVNELDKQLDFYSKQLGVLEQSRNNIYQIIKPKNQNKT